LRSRSSSIRRSSIVPSTPSTIAREIRGDCLGPDFNGSLVVYDDLRLPPTPELIGKLCAVLLSDGRLLVKQLQPGETEGHYDLISLDRPIRNVSVVWAAPIKCVLPRSAIVPRS